MRCTPALALSAALLAVPASAEDWQPLDGPAIRDALTERTLRFPTATQTFYASGRTLYDAGRPSWGYWRIEADRYCSQWPPRGEWACYAVEAAGDAVRFVAPDGSLSTGVRVP
ncbi:hypothetical protein [Pseudaestuariivita sp.]|uniref:hypothetical protein n=1 Tax=Pseudaestuariivita sp. TaxID=2211669 RepID=UPI00405818FB